MEASARRRAVGAGRSSSRPRRGGSGRGRPSSSPLTAVRATCRRLRTSKRLMPGSSLAGRRDPDDEGVDQAAAALGGRLRP